MQTCSVDGCEKGGKITRGWCGMHYWRWSKNGDPLVTQKHIGDPESAFLAYTEPLVGDPGCVVWTGALTRDGYGRFRADGRDVYAHRYSWGRAYGDIPEGLQVDHACHERSCVNVDHLRLATPQQNSANRSGARADQRHPLPRGVSRRGDRYRAQVASGGIHYSLGTFSTPEEASAAAETKRRILFGEYAGRA